MSNGKQYPKFLWIIGGLILVAIVGYAVFKGLTPTKLIFPGGSVEFMEPKNDVVSLRVNVLGPDSMPVDDAKVWLSIGGEAKKVAGGWEFDIPAGRLPPDHKLAVYAEQQDAHLKGHREIVVKDSGALAVTLPLVRDVSGHVKGNVTDASTDRPVAGATVSIVGSAGSTTTDAQGFFSLPANAAEGEVVRLSVLKSGYAPKDQDHPAGENSAYIVIRRRR